MSSAKPHDQHQVLNEQLKLLVRTEKRLQATQQEVERQLTRIKALNQFALSAPSTRSDLEIVIEALQMIALTLPFDGAVAVISEETGQPQVLFLDGENLLEHLTLDAELREALEVATGLDDVVVLPATDTGPIQPLVSWLDALRPGLDPTHFAYQRSTVVFPLPCSDASPNLILCRSATVSSYEKAVTEEDLSYLKLACQHIDSALRIARSTRLLERSVEQRTSELAKANAELETRLAELHGAQKQLVAASRQAGMAEVATSVLHNVGNVLNSVNVSANLVAQLARTSKSGGLAKAVQLLDAQEDPVQFLTQDPRGSALLEYFRVLARSIASERDQMLQELDSLNRNIEHIKVIVSMQQSHAKTGGVIERLALSELIEDALKFNAASYDRHGVEVVTDLRGVDKVQVDRHKLLQIVMNLLSNARHAMKDATSEPRLSVRTRIEDGERFSIEVEDNGVGIPPENLSKIFNYGFTTKREGHGFGLHSSACAAAELGGRLVAHSDGPGRGATFTIILPLAPPERRSSARPSNAALFPPSSDSPAYPALLRLPAGMTR